MIHHSNLFKLGNSHPQELIPGDGGTCLWIHALGGFSKNVTKNENEITPDSLCLQHETAETGRVDEVSKQTNKEFMAH